MRPPPWKRCAPAHAFLASLAEPEQDRMTDALAGASDREGTLLHLLSTMLPEGRKVILRGIQSRPELNGREAAVSATLSEGRVRVQLEHGENIRLRPNCLLPADAASPASEWTLDPLFRGGRWRQMACAKSATASRSRQA